MRKNKTPTHKVDSTKAAVTNLVQIAEDILRVILEEEVSHLGVLGDPLPRG